MKENQKAPMLGIIGGMGPYAALDLQRKILDIRNAQCDQDHVPMLVWNNGVIPDRQLALKGMGESPLNAILEGVLLLERAGVKRIAIACNTAHYWHAKLQKATTVKIFHIAQEIVKTLQNTQSTAGTIGVIATQGALDANLYQSILSKAGYRVLLNSLDTMDNYFMKGCYLVKQGQLKEGAHLIENCAQELIEAGAQYLLLACTEIPLALQSINSKYLVYAIDPTEVLAKACVQWYLQETTKNI